MQIESKIIKRHSVYLLVELSPKRIIIHSVFKKKEYHDDILPIMEIENLGQLLCEYSLSKYSNDTQIHKRTTKAGAN